MDIPRSPIDDQVQRLAESPAAHGHRLYLVGGPIRDQVLGRDVRDLDLTTDATPDVVRRLAGQSGAVAIHDAGARFGTIGMAFRSPDGRSVPVEVTTFRTEKYPDGTRKPEVRFGVSLEEDLWRRDFTMNAIAVDVQDLSLHDPTGGLEDIRHGVIRAVGNAAERFADDPLRLLRAVRFVAQLGFTIDPVTEAAITECADGLARISRERIAAELNLILVSPGAAHGIELATRLGLMAHAIPELLPMKGVSQRPPTHKDVFQHTLGVVRNVAEAELGLRWAALLHDVGKPATRSVHEGEVHFFGHEEVGARMAQRILRGLHLDSALVTRVVALVRNHLRINAYEASWTDAAVRRLIREVEPFLSDLVVLSRADVTSYWEAKRAAANSRVDDFERRARDLMAAQDVAQLRSPLDGDDLMSLFGRAPGPWIRPVKDHLLGLVLDGILGSDEVDRARDLAREFVAGAEHAPDSGGTGRRQGVRAPQAPAAGSAWTTDLAPASPTSGGAAAGRASGHGMRRVPPVVAVKSREGTRGRARTRYASAFRSAAVDAVVHAGVSVATAAKERGVPPSTLRGWVTAALSVARRSPVSDDAPPHD